MQASDAAKVLLIKAIEEADVEHSLLPQADLLDASRHARERADWTQSRADGVSHEEAFLTLRARRLLGDLMERQPRLALLLQAEGAWPWLEWLLPLGALLLGLGAQHVADPHHINLVFAPVLLVLALNVLVYLALAWHGLRGLLSWGSGRRRSAPAAPSGRLQRLARWLGPHGSRGVPLRLFNAWLRFQAEWQQQRGRALAAQVALTLHLSAALLATGLIASLYLGGLFLEYRVGWESTFLNAQQVQGLLTLLHSPWTWWTGQPAPSLAQVQALRFDAAQPPDVAQGAAWVHLYAGLLLLGVVLPRLALHGLARWQRRLANRQASLDLNQPYFVQLLGSQAGRAVRVQLLPCSLSLSLPLHQALTHWSTTRFGEGATLQVLAAPTAAPWTDALSALNSAPGQALVLLCSLASTPEGPLHGQLMDSAREIDPSTRVLLEATTYLDRVGTQAGGAQRLREREHLWADFCRQHQLRCELISLSPADAQLFHSPLWTPPAPPTPTTR
jgi:hypothetical protein